MLGQEQEARLDEHFGSRFTITEASMDEQRKGIDRWFTTSAGLEMAIEYKADFQSHATGNAFVETVSVGKYTDGEFVVKKHGWAETSTADWLMYLVVGTGKLFITKPRILRANLGDWANRFRSVTVRNQGYQGRGLLVPLSEFEHKSVKTEKLGD